MTFRKLLLLLLLCLAALTLVQNPGKTTNSYPIHSDDQYGYANQAGKLVVPPRFDSAREFVDGASSLKVNH